MTKTNLKKPIDADDLRGFVEESSDFGFEMSVLAGLRALGFQCEHSGVYSDPVTTKIRQFDIRAERKDGNRRLALAVECKNIKDSSPLLVSAVPRTKSESFHHILHLVPNAVRQDTKTVTGLETPYRVDALVGKRTDQVSRDKNGLLISDDAATFDKMNQAVSSCRDLVIRNGVVRSPIDTAIVPLLVVPSGRLWQVGYDAEGNRTSDPAPVERCSLFLDHSWPIDNTIYGPVDFRMSHLEVVCLDALPAWVEVAFGGDGFFPESA
jgi:hypothetical protein